MTRSAALVLLVVLAGGPTSAQSPEARQRASDLFDKLGESTALAWDAQTIRSFEALCKDTALPRLIAAYRKGRRAHPGQLRALLADAIGRRGVTDKTALEEIRKFFALLAKGEEHAWASFRCAQVLARHGEDVALLQEVLSKEPYWRRVAALEALGRSKQTWWLEGVAGWLPGCLKLKQEARDSVAVSFAWSVARHARPGYEREKPPPKPKPKPPAKKPPVEKPPVKKPPESPARARRRKALEDARKGRERELKLAREKAKQRRLAQRAKIRKRTQAALDAAIDLLDEPTISLQAKRKIAKGLQHAFRTKTAPVESDAWRALSGGEPAPRKAPATAVRGARFMSIHVDGERIVFLLDASDSMLKPLTSKERLAFGKLFRPAARRTVERVWKRVKTRFDAARVHLISTLRRLEKKQRFAILFFGDDPQVCRATRGFVKASKKNVRSAVAALQDFLPKPPTKLKPIGSLLGQTNYYGSFFSAYKQGPRGAVKTDYPEVHRGLIRRGADQIFLLSDGAPNMDGFGGSSPQIDRERTIYKTEKIGERKVNMDYRDPETGALVKRPPQTVPIYKYTPIRKVKERYKTPYPYGPYVAQAPFLLEIERLNLIRKVTLHTIAIGEGKAGFLSGIAERGYGTFLDVTKVK